MYFSVTIYTSGTCWRSCCAICVKPPSFPFCHFVELLHQYIKCAVQYIVLLFHQYIAVQHIVQLYKVSLYDEQRRTPFSQFGGTRNGTSGAEIKILRPPTPPNQPPKPPKRHLRNPNRTSKSHFWPFCVFLIFLPHFPLSTGHFFQMQTPSSKSTFFGSNFFFLAFLCIDPVGFNVIC